MEVKIEIRKELASPYAIIVTQEITEEVSEAVELLKKDKRDEFLALEQNEKYVFVRPEEIFLIRYEENRVAIYTQNQKLYGGRHLYEVEEKVGNAFMRISKTTLINLNKMESVEPSFGGTMYLIMKNGCKDYISRKYLPAFKKYLGL